ATKNRERGLSTSSANCARVQPAAVGREADTAATASRSAARAGLTFGFIARGLEVQRLENRLAARGKLGLGGGQQILGPGIFFDELGPAREQRGAGGGPGLSVEPNRRLGGGQA